MGYVDLNENKRTDWVTPLDCRRLLAQLGPLKLDVCTNPDNPMGAEQFYTSSVNGLEQSWQCGGLVWCNHPWSRKDSPLWVNKAVCEGELVHKRAHEGGIALCLRCGKDLDVHVFLGDGYYVCRDLDGCFELGSTEIVLLGPSRPDTAWFRNIWGSADVIYFWKGRMTFWDPRTGMPHMAWNKKTKRWENQPVPVPVQLSYWGHRPHTFVDVFMQQGGAFAYPTPF